MASASDTTYSYRRRQAANDPVGQDETRLLLLDNARARAERKLIFNTRALPNNCGLLGSDLVTWDHLFRPRNEPMTDMVVRNINHRQRILIVKKIVEAREAAGFDPKGLSSSLDSLDSSPESVTQWLEAMFKSVHFSKLIAHFHHQSYWIGD